MRRQILEPTIQEAMRDGETHIADFINDFLRQILWSGWNKLTSTVLRVENEIIQTIFPKTCKEKAAWKF